MIKIAHLTSAHPRYDTRIFIKECQSLAINNYDTNLIVADGKGEGVMYGIKIYDVGKSLGRINRIFKTTKKVYQKAIELDASIYHLHDPELIPIGLKLLRKGKKVIFDAHEDLPKQILSKPYLNSWQRKSLSWVMKRYESYALSKFTGIVAATPFIRDKFKKINVNTLDVNNYPVLSEFSNKKKKSINGNEDFCITYIGGLSEVRGIKEIVKSMKFTNVKIRLKIAGNFSEKEFEKKVKLLDEWELIDELGFLSREEIQKLLSISSAGLVVLHPTISYLDSLPVKMFEYMAAGLPVIASDFPLWREIIETNECGLCVNPLDSRCIAKAINFFASNKKLAQKMGLNGKKSVLNKYNWGIEENKLLKFYSKVNG